MLFSHRSFCRPLVLPPCPVPFKIVLARLAELHCKERQKIREFAKFESDLLKTNDGLTPQRHEILQTFVRWVKEGESL